MSDFMMSFVLHFIRKEGQKSKRAKKRGTWRKSQIFKVETLHTLAAIKVNQETKTIGVAVVR